MNASIKPFQVSISDDELDLLRQKLKFTRLPRHTFTWTEENDIDTAFLQSVLDFWLNEYSWRNEESQINKTLPQFTTKIPVEAGNGAGVGNEGVELDIHFVHSLATSSPQATDEGKVNSEEPTPLLFLHGWPGSFLEVSRGLKALNKAGFHVVAPSLPGYGFSSYVPNRGFDHRGHARVLDSLMRKLGYEEYVVQGGDWGSQIARAVGQLFPERVRGVHVNMFITPLFDIPDPEPALTLHEARLMDRSVNYFLKHNSAYSQIQAQRPLTLGHAMHDSPMGLLSYIADKLITWSDGYPWTKTELITWTLMHYFPGPTTGFVMYTENNPSPLILADSWANSTTTTAAVGGGGGGKTKNSRAIVPLGVSSMNKELIMMPRAWAPKKGTTTTSSHESLLFYREHEVGGHFAMWEQPDILVKDVIDFVARL